VVNVDMVGLLDILENDDHGSVGLGYCPDFGNMLSPFVLGQSRF
jgi:hypothetical protein